MHFASALALIPEIKSLLASGVSANERGHYGNTALDVAVSTGDVDTIRVLYKTGQADLHARQMASVMPVIAVLQREKQKNHVLHTAAWYRHKEATVYLLNAGSKPLIPDKDGRTALDIAVNAGNGPLAEILMDKPSTREVVSFAAQRGRLETLKWLVESEHIDLSDSFTDPLDVAIQYDQAPCVRYLSTMFHRDDRYLQNVYHLAVKHGSIGVLVDFVITRRVVDIKLADNEGRSALHNACLNGKVEAASFLIGAGIDTALTDSNGYTALELLLAEEVIACTHKQQADIMTAFRDPQIRKKPPPKGGNLLHLALEFGRRRPRMYYWHPEPDNYIFIDILLGWGLDSLERDSSGRTILHAAATRANSLLDTVLGICDLANAQDHQGQTPLHTLLKGNRQIPKGIIQSLLAKMPSLELQDHNGRTVVHHAVLHETETSTS
jgi:ankyrin repeat protein